MNTTIRNRAAALGIAVVAGLAGVGATGGTAMGSTGSQAGSVSSPGAAVSQGSQSDGHPKHASAYADKLVRAWGNGSDIEVGERAAKGVVDILAEHGDEHATHWDRIAADADTSWTDVVYKNTITQEVMTLTVSNNTAEVDEEQAVRYISFHIEDGSKS